jgi:hypothetical protein
MRESGSRAPQHNSKWLAGSAFPAWELAEALALLDDDVFARLYFQKLE